MLASVPHLAPSSAFADALAEVPPFFNACMGSFLNLGEGIRQLRLVSREVGRAALLAVRKVKVRLEDSPAPILEEEEECGYYDPPEGYYYNQWGGKRYPFAAEVVTFMSRTAPLQALNITVVIKSGPSNAPAAQQLTACISQLACVLNILGPAILGVTNLKLTVELPSFSVQAKDSRGRLIPPTERPPPLDPTTTPGMYPQYDAAGVFCDVGRQIVSTVCHTLAAACPRLSTLSLEDCRHVNIISLFGPTCPDLSRLTVQAMSAPVESLQGLGRHLPRLTHFTIAADSRSTEVQLDVYTAAVFHELAACKQLSHLDLDYHSNMTLEAGRGLPLLSWGLLPEGIVSLRVACKWWGCTAAFPVLKHLQSLTMCTGCGDIWYILKACPSLQILTAVEGSWLNSDTGPSIDLMRGMPADLQARFTAGLTIACPSISLSGDGDDMQRMLTWLPPMNLTTRSRLNCNSGSTPPTYSSFVDLPRVFPNLTELCVMWITNWHAPDNANGEVLAPLLRCTALRKVDLMLPMRLTSASLIHLCLGLPQLNNLCYPASVGVVHADVVSALRRARRTVKLVVYKDDDYGNDYSML